MTTPFDQKKAAALLGHPGEAFEQVSPYHLPEIYWIRIGSGSNVLGGPFIVRNGELVTTKGYATASAWLRRAVLPLEATPQADHVAQVLGAYDALPLGWTAAGADGIRLHPFELELVSQGYIYPQSRDPKRMMPPASPPPPGAPGGGPPGAPGGGPPGAPGGGPPGGGYAPPQPCRAILKEVNGKLTWIVEQHHAPFADDKGGWSLLLTEPIE